MKKIIDQLESLIKDPSKGLPEEVFLFVSRITPLINVDLLIKNEQNHTVLTWRDDGYYPPSWHIPGGIIRYKETISDRINAVAASELGAKVKFKEDPLAINEIIHHDSYNYVVNVCKIPLPSRRNRGHGISLLYACTLIGPLDEDLRYEKGIPKPGEWAWHKKCPNDIIPVHNEIYRRFI